MMGEPNNRGARRSYSLSNISIAEARRVREQQVLLILGRNANKLGAFVSANWHTMPSRICSAQICSLILMNMCAGAVLA